MDTHTHPSSEQHHQIAGWLAAAGPDAHIELRSDIPIPTAAADEVVIRVECSGVCHSDVHRMFGDRPLMTGVLGHEGVGRVVEVGSDASAELMDKRVGVGWLGSACMDCEICAVDYTACPLQKNPGRDIPGTFQQYMAAPAGFVTVIPERLASELAAPLLCAGVTMYSAIRKLGLHRGAWVVIQGAGGGLGHIGIQICRKWGYRVIAVDTGPAKRDLCTRLGANEFIDFEKEDPAARVRASTADCGAHAVLCTAGSAMAYTQAPALVRRRGVVSCLGLTAERLAVSVSPREIATWGITITGSTVGSASEVRGVLAMVEAGEVVPAVQTVEVGELDRVLRDMRDGELGAGRVVVRMP